MRRWFEEDFDRETADQFIDECRRFTEEFIINYAREMIPSWPLTNVLPSHLFDFQPEGVVVHSSETPSLWNALHMCTRHVYGTHFMVLAGRRMPHQDQLHYPLLAQLPTTVLMLYPLDAIVPHAGYISTKTWGIELRNAGRLRPVEKGLQPTPLMPSELTERNFKADPDKRYDVYWHQNLWCYPFEGQAARWEDYYYEMPTTSQVISLVALLRVLDFYAGGLDRRMVIPSNCINGSEPKLPLIAWNAVRLSMIEREVIKPEYEWLSYLSNHLCQFEAHDLENEDESFIGEQLESMRWRGEREDGQLQLLLSERKFVLAKGYRRSLEYLGYDSIDMNFSLHMWALAKGMLDVRDEEIYNRLNRESPLSVK